VLAVEDCFIYQPDIKRVTSANSFIAGGRTVYIVKKDSTGKSIKIYNAYDKDTKTQLSSHWDKDILIKYLQTKDLSCLGSTQGSLF
jgi:hypothetical protein